MFATVSSEAHVCQVSSEVHGWLQSVVRHMFAYRLVSSEAHICLQSVTGQLFGYTVNGQYMFVPSQWRVHVWVRSMKEHIIVG